MDNRGHWAIGLAIVCVGHVVAYIVGAGVTGLLQGFSGSSDLAGFLWMGGLVPGLTQILWVVPIAVWAGVTGRKSTLIGLLVTAGIVFLLNAACFGGMALLFGGESFH
jgi:hypothetical protein